MWCKIRQAQNPPQIWVLVQKDRRVRKKERGKQKEVDYKFLYVADESAEAIHADYSDFK